VYTHKFAVLDFFGQIWFVHAKTLARISHGWYKIMPMQAQNTDLSHTL
jgi:hypothetical protein